MFKSLTFSHRWERAAGSGGELGTRFCNGGRRDIKEEWGLKREKDKAIHRVRRSCG